MGASEALASVGLTMAKKVFDGFHIILKFCFFCAGLCRSFESLSEQLVTCMGKSGNPYGG